MIRRLRHIILFSILFTLLSVSFVIAGDSDKGEKSRSRVKLAKSADLNGPVESVLNINSLTSWVATDGFFDATINSTRNSVFQIANGEYPKGSGIGVIFKEGIVWGAKVSDDNPVVVRAGGSSRTNSLQGGKAVGYAANPYSAPTGFEDPAAQQVWRVRRDYLTADLSADAASFNLIDISDVTAAHTTDLFSQYAHDWVHWPADKGAPYEDIDGNGSYDPVVDIPGFPGASQTIWFVSNDLDDDVASRLAGAPSIGLEMQMTLWAYDFPNILPLRSTIFKRVRLIYTGRVDGPSGAHIDTMYISQWSDPDLGDHSDDFVGWDSTLQMGYVYNGRSIDSEYANFGLNPPAAGYTLLKGPVMGAETLVSNSFNSSIPGDIDIPNRGVYSGTLQWFNRMEGFLARPGYPEQVPRINPITGAETKFWLDGNPIEGEGWVDGLFSPPGDRRMLMSTGPFEMALGDTQDIIIALIAGIGKNRLESIVEIRKAARITHTFYENGLSSFPVPELTLDQPNSSQADLTITLDLSVEADEVMIKIYNYNDVLEGSLTLFDDGNSGDEAAGDGRWGVQWLTDQRPYGMYASALIISGTDTSEWEHLVDSITTLGPVELVDMIILNDNINNDGVINSGEKFSFNPVINNGSSFGIGLSSIETFSSDDYIILKSFIKASTIKSFPPGISIVQDNPEQYFVLSDNTPDGHLLTLRSLITDKLHNRWEPQIQLDVKTLAFNVEVGNAEHDAGTADGVAGYRVADPTKLTGDFYEISFNDQLLFFDVDGKWKFANSDSTIPKSIGKVTDISGSSVSGATVFSKNDGTWDFVFIFDFVSSADGEGADGFKLTFSAGVNILGGGITGAWGSSIGSGQNCPNYPDGLIDVAANSIMWGDSARSEFGCIENDVVFVVNTERAPIPIAVAWEAYDDGSGSATVDASGSVSLRELGSQYKTEKHWNLLNVTTSDILLQSQPFPEDIYSNDIPATEGFKVVLADFTLELPTTFYDTEFSVDADPSDGDLNLRGDGSLFLNPDGYYTDFGSGTPIPTIEQAQSDLEFRFTGVAPDNDSPVTQGGSFSTQWEKAAFGNPDVASFKRVQLRLPFEVWNVEGTDSSLHHQIEVAVINVNADRDSPYGFGVGNPSIAGMEPLWRMPGRDYIVILNKQYTDDPAPVRSLVDPTATWLLFWQQGGASVWSAGDVFTIRYANPLQVGVDLFRFQGIYTPRESEAPIPENFELSQNYPNPFNPVTTIKYRLLLASDVKLVIYNLLGQEVFRLALPSQQAGVHLISWNGRNMQGSELSSGIYLYQLRVGDFVQTRKMVLLK